MNLRLIELRHLRYFLAVAETSHFTKAAGKLNVTQPTLSHQIRQLEGQLNLSLFDRIGRRVRLTSAGELLLPHARRVLKELEDAHTALSELSQLKRGELDVGIVQTVNACVIPEIVGRFSATHPGVRVNCLELAVEDIESGLHTGKLHIGISFFPPVQNGLMGERLFTEELVGVVPEEHALAKRKRLRVSEIGAEDLVLLSRKYCTRQLIDQAFLEAGVAPHVRIEMNSVERILSTVRQARLATLLPSLALCEKDAGLRAIPLINPTPRRAIGILWPKGAQRRAAAKAFAQITAEILEARKLGTRSSTTLRKRTGQGIASY